LEVAAGYVATVSCENSLAVGDFERFDFAYYPNPTTGIINITAATEMSEVSVYNITGQLLLQNKINAMDANVNLTAFSTGTYFFRLKFGDFVKTFKVVKQ